MSVRRPAMTTARVVTAPHSTKTPVVTIEDVESYPAEDSADCEYIVTPKAIKVVHGGSNC